MRIYGNSVNQLFFWSMTKTLNLIYDAPFSILQTLFNWSKRIWTFGLVRLKISKRFTGSDLSPRVSSSCTAERTSVSRLWILTFSSGSGKMDTRPRRILRLRRRFIINSKSCSWPSAISEVWFRPISIWRFGKRGKCDD